MMRSPTAGWAVLLGTVAFCAGAAAEPAPPPAAAPGLPTRAQQPVAGTPTPAAQGGAVAAAIPEPIKLSDDPRPTLGPSTFVGIMNAADRYRQVAEAGGWAAMPAGLSALKAGARSPLVPPLRERLVLSEDAPTALADGSDVLDDAVQAAIRRFQMRHGLEETGLVGRRTLAQLNVPAAARLNQLQASAARLIGSRFPFGERYVAVNIPAATVEAVQNGTVARRYVAIVGKTDRPSPAVETRVTNINFNPTWTVPVSLVKKDIIPHMRRDPGYLARMRIRMIDGTGQIVDPATIDWSTERAVNYTLRQDPGSDNSLGAIRIDMPNRHAVYMHDTPSKTLFSRESRLMSSGCVRVAGVLDLARWLLEGTPASAGPGSAWGAADVDAAVASGARQDVKLAKPVPVAWVYLTGYASPDGTVHFRDDVYGLDAPAEPPAAAPAAHTVTIDTLLAPTGRL